MIDERMFLKNNEEVKDRNQAINIIREKLQIFIIASLEDTDFYNNFAFTGGTCLRIMHKTGRYSEDLDFDSVNEKYQGYNFVSCFNTVQNFFKLLNINCSIESKEKKIISSIKSFYINFNLKELFHKFNLNYLEEKTQKEQKLKIQFEVETDFNKGEKFENLEDNFPLYSINTVEKGSMMANKLNAILRRNEYINIKGRDFYDLKYYIDSGVDLNIELFNYCFKRDGYTLNDVEIFDDPPKNKDELIVLIQKKLKNINFELVREDINKFVQQEVDSNIYNSDYFCKLVEKINVNYNNLKEFME